MSFFIMKIFFLLLFALPCFGLNFHKSAETLDKIQEIISRKEKGVYFRFGDGDVYLASGIDDSLQKSDLFLMLELQEAFGLNGANVLKCLPLNCKEFNGYEEGMNRANHERFYEWCQDILKLSIPIWNGPIDDVYSMTALAYTATNKVEKCLSFLKFLKSSGVCLLVGNENIPKSIQELLFGPNCHFVSTPTSNSYSQIDRIEEECLKNLSAHVGYKIVVTSLGCSGRALQKRLYGRFEDIFLFDFGSLMDAICGWDTREWITVNLSTFQNDLFLQKLQMAL